MANLMDLPTELRLAIYNHLPCKTGERNPFNLAQYKSFSPRTGQAPDTPMEWLFSHPTIYKEGLNVVLAHQTSAIFHHVRDMAKGHGIESLLNATEVTLDLGDVPQRDMRRALYRLRKLPRLEVIHINVTARNIKGVHIPDSWTGFPALDAVTLRDCALEEEDFARKRTRRAKVAHHKRVIAWRQMSFGLEVHLDNFDGAEEAKIAIRKAEQALHNLRIQEVSDAMFPPANARRDALTAQRESVNRDVRALVKYRRAVLRRLKKSGRDEDRLTRADFRRWVLWE